MKRTLRTVEGALKSLYAIDTPYRAEDFILRKQREDLKHLEGALCVRSGETVEVGIHLSPPVKKTATHLPLKRPVTEWTFEQLNAFSIVTEEVSHFHYFLFQSHQGRPVSQLELELQGEIDRFLLCLLSVATPEKDFDNLIDRLFDHYRLRDHVNAEQAARYEEANTLAKNFLLKHLKRISQHRDHEAMLRLLRRYYRLASSEKLALASSK
ncbi:MAG: hypothetical protein HYZ71_12185 [Deltaproteobacteria bacterium]|nr:hypothetical protein [Deltaproteobacteria bacterium]